MFDPIKRTEEAILDFLDQNRGKEFSSWEIQAGLNMLWRMPDIQEALGRLFDRDKIKLNEERKWTCKKD